MGIQHSQRHSSSNEKKENKQTVLQLLCVANPSEDTDNDRPDSDRVNVRGDNKPHFSKKKENTQRYDFMISHANISMTEEAPLVAFIQDVDICIRRCSRTAALDECVVEDENNITVAKVRVKVRGFLGVSLDDAIKELCNGLIISSGGNRARVEVLTDRSIWGIIPISPAFNTYWTATFFNDILINGPRRFEEYRQASEPYLVVPLVLMSVATLFKIDEIFYFMHSVLSQDTVPNFDMAAFLGVAMPTIAAVLQRFSAIEEREASRATMRERHNEALTVFKNRTNSVMDRFKSMEDLTWMHNACSEICQMSTAAAVFMTGNKKFLDMLVEHIRQAYATAMVGGAVSTASAVLAASNLWSSLTITSAASTAGAASTSVASASGAFGGIAAVLSPIFLGGLIFSIGTGLGAWRSYKEAKDLEVESDSVRM
ncbi:general substrate transporter, partial [Trichoderma arundinaceum]